MKRFAIIADDYTGSNDTGVQFAKKGLQTLVTSQLETLADLNEAIDVIVVNTTSRADTPEDAYEKVAQATRALRQMEVDYIYKKLDSTLRGNIGAEIAGAMEAGGYQLAIVAPGLPSNGRTTIGGIQLVHGVPLEKTEIAKDPVAPVRYSFVPAIIQEQTDYSVDVVNLQDVLQGSEHVAQLIRQKAEAGAEILVIDGVAQDDLDRIAESIALLDQDCLLVGSAGFAESLPEPLGLIRETEVESQEGAIVAIAGSVSDVTREQVKYAAQNWDVKIVDIQLEQVLTTGYSAELERVVAEVKELIGRYQDLIIRSAETRNLVERAREIGAEQGLTHLEVSQRIAQFLGQVAKEIYFTHGLRGLLLTGGDIAIQCASYIGAKATLIKDEVLPGIPVGTLVGEDLPPIPVVTKAGAFGDEQTFVQIFKYLRGVV